MKSKRIVVLHIIAFLLVSNHFSGQEILLANLDSKHRVEFYPSLNMMYGAGFYKLNTGYYKFPEYKYFNQNFNLGVFLNMDWKLKPDLFIQFYIGYNRWLQANLFPVGLMLKPKINKKPNEFYLKMGGGYTLGKRYDDIHEVWLPSSMPNDYGNGSVHLQGGLEKNWHLSKGKSFSLGFMFNIQFIKSYYRESAQAWTSEKLSAYFIPYKFAGLTIAYHFY